MALATGFTSKKGFMKKKLCSCLLSTFTVFVRGQGRKVAAAETAVEVVPRDVKEGCFAVFAVEDEEEKEEGRRFIVELSFLSDPAFLKLLEKAEEEFGFQQEGVLCLPCKSDELRRIISKHNYS